jgi:hypothetical protein
MIDWLVPGESYSNCNCDHACPCQFGGLPTHHACKGFEVFRVGNGSCESRGAIKLDLQDTCGQFNYLDHTGEGAAHVR